MTKRRSSARPQPSSDELALLKSFLHERDALCPVCSYNLRNLTSGTCPECGQRVALRVGTPDLRLGVFVWALAPLLMMAGTGCFTLLVVIMEGPPPGATWGLWGLFALAAVDLAAGRGPVPKACELLPPVAGKASASGGTHRGSARDPHARV